MQPPEQYSQYDQINHYGRPTSRQKKSLLIGINYQGQAHALQGCRQDVRNMSQFLISRGYPSDERSMVVLADDRPEPFYPTGANILAAMDWLVSSPGTQCFLHYSGHGGQVKDPDGDRASGFDDTIVPVDYQTHGQLDSDTLHRHLVSKLHPTSTLFVVFDCCHSGSAIELPFVYRPDAEGNVNLMDNVKEGLHLMQAAQHLLQGGFSANKIGEAKQLFAGAQSFFQGLKHRGEGTADEEGLDEEKFMEDWVHEGKSVFMFSGCRDDQTSADANIGGSHVGAMSWALLETLYSRPGQSYIQVLQNTRQLLEGKYQQVPQLSVGTKVDLDQPLNL
ncbi:MAG: hypothetical protein LQ350_003436 [Teloschistes chrysophthalmus]|nr:MAG: hypothetical protein LQ350_003436 [Niorma chrysophthalma]